jgi:transmembrane sensor
MTLGLDKQGADIDRSLAADWVVRLHEEGADEGDWLAFEAWLNASAGHRAAFDSAEALWTEINTRAEEIAEALEHDARERGRWWARTASGALAAAAIIALLAPFGARLMPVPSVAYATETGQRRSLQLADGSRVDLNSGSSIRVTVGRGRRDVVMNDAEAAFDVVHDPAHPFIIHAGDQTIQVVGTQFDVSHRDGMISVTVRRGVVQVASREGGAPVALTPGQQLRHYEGANGSVVAQVSADDAFAWRQGRLICRDEALSDVAANLNHAFRTPIRIADNQTAALRFSGVLTVDDEASTLKRLTSLLPLSATPSEGVIVLRARDMPR